VIFGILGVSGVLKAEVTDDFYGVVGSFSKGFGLGILFSYFLFSRNFKNSSSS
jgi:hypothetical protein